MSKTRLNSDPNAFLSSLDEDKQTFLQMISHLLVVQGKATVQRDDWEAIGNIFDKSPNAVRWWWRRIEENAQRAGIIPMELLELLVEGAVDPHQQLVDEEDNMFYFPDLGVKLVITDDQQSLIRQMYTGRGVTSKTSSDPSTIATYVGLTPAVISAFIKQRGWTKDSLPLDLEDYSSRDEVNEALDEVREQQFGLNYKRRSFMADMEAAHKWKNAQELAINPIVDALAEVRDGVTRPANKANIESEESLIAYLSLFNDLHYGKQGDGFNMRTATERLDVAMETLLNYLERLGVKHLLVTLGGDTLNFDGLSANTTSGTKVTYSDNTRVIASSYVRMLFSRVTNLVNDPRFEKITFVLTPGNHDYWSSILVFNGLAAALNNNPKVEFLNLEGEPRCYYKHGDLLFLLGHGTKEKANDVVSLAWAEAPNDLLRSTNKIVALFQHLHIQRILTPRGATVIRSLALSGTDDWHKLNKYISEPGAETHVFSKKERVGHFEKVFGRDN